MQQIDNQIISDYSDYFKQLDGDIADFAKRYELLGGNDDGWFVRHVGPLISLRHKDNVIAIDVDGKRVWTRKAKLECKG